MWKRSKLNVRMDQMTPTIKLKRPMKAEIREKL